MKNQAKLKHLGIEGRESYYYLKFGEGCAGVHGQYYPEGNCFL